MAKKIVKAPSPIVWGQCEEAVGSAGTQPIRCTREAVMVIQHRGRREGPYQMCRQCGTHNTHNRDAEMLAEREPAPAPVDPETQALVRQASPILTFTEGVSVFLEKARTLEDAAKANLQRAQGLRRPTSATEDAHVQAFVLECNAATKEVEAHWSITTIISQFHRALTGRRGLSVDANTRAAKLATDLHNAYANEERRKAQVEEDRRRREEEDRARERQRQEAARLEQAALDAEAASADLSDRERLFVSAIARGELQTVAAQRAGYKDAIKMGAKLLALPKILAAIQGEQDAQTARRQAEAIQAAPVEVEHVEVLPNVTTIGRERTTYSGEVLDHAAAVEAFRGGKHGIPGDLFMVNPTKLNEYARTMHELIDRWPGVRLVKKTTLS